MSINDLLNLISDLLIQRKFELFIKTLTLNKKLLLFNLTDLENTKNSVIKLKINQLYSENNIGNIYNICKDLQINPEDYLDKSINSDEIIFSLKSTVVEFVNQYKSQNQNFEKNEKIQVRTYIQSCNNIIESKGIVYTAEKIGDNQSYKIYKSESRCKLAGLKNKYYKKYFQPEIDKIREIEINFFHSNFPFSQIHRRSFSNTYFSYFNQFTPKKDDLFIKSNNINDLIYFTYNGRTEIRINMTYLEIELTIRKIKSKLENTDNEENLIGEIDSHNYSERNFMETKKFKLCIVEDLEIIGFEDFILKNKKNLFEAKALSENSIYYTISKENLKSIFQNEYLCEKKFNEYSIKKCGLLLNRLIEIKKSYLNQIFLKNQNSYGRKNKRNELNQQTKQEKNDELRILRRIPINKSNKISTPVKNIYHVSKSNDSKSFGLTNGFQGNSDYINNQTSRKFFLKEENIRSMSRNSRTKILVENPSNAFLNTRSFRSEEKQISIIKKNINELNISSTGFMKKLTNNKNQSPLEEYDINSTVSYVNLLEYDNRFPRSSSKPQKIKKKFFPSIKTRYFFRKSASPNPKIE